MTKLNANHLSSCSSKSQWHLLLFVYQTVNWYYYLVRSAPSCQRVWSWTGLFEGRRRSQECLSMSCGADSSYYKCCCTWYWVWDSSSSALRHRQWTEHLLASGLWRKGRRGRSGCVARSSSRPSRHSRPPCLKYCGRIAHRTSLLAAFPCHSACVNTRKTTVTASNSSSLVIQACFQTLGYGWPKQVLSLASSDTNCWYFTIYCLSSPIFDYYSRNWYRR